MTGTKFPLVEITGVNGVAVLVNRIAKARGLSLGDSEAGPIFSINTGLFSSNLHFKKQKAIASIRIYKIGLCIFNS